MNMHSEFLLNLAADRQHELIAEADRSRLLAKARTARKARKARESRGRPAGTLTSCEPSAVVPAR